MGPMKDFAAEGTAGGVPWAEDAAIAVMDAKGPADLEMHIVSASEVVEADPYLQGQWCGSLRFVSLRLLAAGVCIFLVGAAVGAGVFGAIAHRGYGPPPGRGPPPGESGGARLPGKEGGGHGGKKGGKKGGGEGGKEGWEEGDEEGGK